MTCKNCGSSLRSDFGYCPTCGAKVIRNRLTVKHIWQDLSFQVFNLDNTLLKTFRHLFSQPEIVVESYITGIRKKYMNPISYFAIAVTLSGILYFVLRDIYAIELVPNTSGAPNMDFIFDYQGLMSYFFLPYYALVTWILFLDKSKLNFTEHLVANSYITAQTYFIQALVCIPLFGFFDFAYDTVNWYFLILMTFYQFYVLGKIHQTGFLNTFVRSLGFMVFFFIFMMIVGIIFLVFMLVSGQATLQDFVPK